MGICAVLAFLHIQGQPFTPLWMRFSSILVFSAAGGLIPGALFYSALHVAPSHETVSTTIGLMLQWSSIGQFIGPPIVAAVAIAMGGWHWTWLMTSSMCLLGCVFAFGIQKYWQLSSQHASQAHQDNG